MEQTLEQVLSAGCASWSAPSPSKHGIAIVSACVANQDPDWSLLCETASANHRSYAKRHGYGLLLASCALPHGRSDHWSKLPLLLAVLATPVVAHAFWMDADSLFLDMEVNGHAESAASVVPLLAALTP